MKQTLQFVLLLLFLVTPEQQGKSQSMVITMHDGSTIDKSLSQIRDLSFSTDSLFLTSQTFIKNDYSLDEIRKISFESLVDINESNLTQGDIFIYPNPVMNKLSLGNISDKPVTANIYRIDGCLVKQATVTKDDAIIKVSDLSEGIYMIQLNETTLKFIKR